MAEWRILHAADLHLDTSFKGLRAQDETLASRLREAPFQALERIVRHAIEQEVDLVLFAGDTFDSQTPELRAYFAFRDALEELREQGIPVSIVAGNHDPLPAWKKELSLPDNAHLYGADEPERRLYDKEGIPGLEVVGLSFPEAVVKEKLTKRFPKADPDRFSIALMHGTFGEAGSHHPYNPFRTEDVSDKGYQLWALGHIHERGTPHPQHPIVHYAGNPQGRHPNEDGPCGVTLIRLQKGYSPQLEFFATHQVRYEHLFLDLTGVEELDELEARFEERIRSDLSSSAADESFVVRLSLKGRTSLHAVFQEEARLEELRQRLSIQPSRNGPFRYIDRLEDRTWPDRDPEELRKRGDLLGELWREFEALKEDPESLDGILQELQGEYGGRALKKEQKALSEKEKEEVLERALWKLMDEFLQNEEEKE